MSDDFDPEAETTSEGWKEIAREEALVRIERALTEDLVSFEVDTEEDPTAVGVIVTHTWFVVTDVGQREFMLAMRDPAKSDAPVRWFIPTTSFLSDW